MWLYGDSDAVDISIHALRKESDGRSCGGTSACSYFNPRSP